MADERIRYLILNDNVVQVRLIAEYHGRTKMKVDFGDGDVRLMDRVLNDAFDSRLAALEQLHKRIVSALGYYDRRLRHISAVLAQEREREVRTA